MAGVVDQDARPPARRPPEKPPGRARLAPDARHRQLVDVAGRLLTEAGPRGVRIDRVARAAGVTRPVVYRFFPNRDALLIAVLESYASSLRARFDAALAIAPSDVPRSLDALIAATFDFIAEHGAGAWRLLAGEAASGPVEDAAARVRRALIRPWDRRIRRATGAGSAEAVVLRQVLVASTHAVLSAWADGQLGRRTAQRELKRTLGAVVGAYRS
jgi:AcrR family transcriptional regulator